MKRRVGLSVPVKDNGTGYGPTVRLTRRLEQNGWGAAVERAEVYVAGGSDGWEDAELGVEEEPKQERQKETGAGDLVPEMDRADSLLSGPSRTLGLLRIGVRSRTRKQKPEETAERSGIPMVVWIGDQEEEADGQQHERRRDATLGAASISHLKISCGHVDLSPLSHPSPPVEERGGGRWDSENHTSGIRGSWMNGDPRSSSRRFASHRRSYTAQEATWGYRPSRTKTCSSRC